MSITHEPLIDTKAAASMLGLSPLTLSQWRAERNPDQPPFVRVGSKAVRYRPSAVAAWAASRECKPSKHGTRKADDPGSQKSRRGRR